MYNDGLHCRTVFSLFSWSCWSLFYELNFSSAFSSVGEFIVCCSCLDFVFLLAAAKSCSMYLSAQV